MKKTILILLISLMLVSGCDQELNVNVIDKGIPNITEAETPELYFQTFNDSNSIKEIFRINSQPQGITFTMDYVEFTDGNLILSTREEDFLFNFNITDFIEWNIGNETYRYEKK